MKNIKAVKLVEQLIGEDDETLRKVRDFAEYILSTSKNQIDKLVKDVKSSTSSLSVWRLLKDMSLYNEDYGQFVLDVDNYSKEDKKTISSVLHGEEPEKK